jgi:hypothetical protein
LGGVDITQDAATGFRVVVEAYDFATSQPLKITFTVYDAADPTGTKNVSIGTMVLDAAISSSESKILPFSNLTKLDTALAPANLKNVGAITMLIDASQSVSHDIVLSFIGTNGRCDHVPVNRLVLDQCGVCNGNNLSCADCAGTPNGTQLAGVSCSTGKLGICGDGVLQGKYPSCLCSESNKPALEICDGVDNNCDGVLDDGAPTTGPLLDVCGVCNGDGKSCADCKGVPNGTAKLDECKVCGGDGSSCLAGMPHGFS